MKADKKYKESLSRTIPPKYKSGELNIVNNRSKDVTQACVINAIQQKGIVQGFFHKINNVAHQQQLAQRIYAHVPNATQANGAQVVNDIVAGNGTHTVVNGSNLLHASAGNLQHTATAFYRYINTQTVIILALGHHIGNDVYQLDYRHPGFNGNVGNNFIDLNAG